MAKTLALPLYKLKWLKTQEQDFKKWQITCMVFEYFFTCIYFTSVSSSIVKGNTVYIYAIILGSDGSRGGSLGSDESP